MTEISWKVVNQQGKCDLQTINDITVELNDELLDVVEANLHVPRAPRMFFNGYQTWTWCPEYKNYSVIRDLRFMPKPGSG